FAAWSPFGPFTMSNSTFWPSSSDLKPSPPIALKWTNTSSPPGWEMKPNPFSGLNHFTVPVGMGDPPFWRLVFERRVARYEEPRELATRKLYVLRLKTA